ncbi:MAG: hypothetical protein AABW81_02040 [Nanoarchaeota archaeon]
MDLEKIKFNISTTNWDSDSELRRKSMTLTSKATPEKIDENYLTHNIDEVYRKLYLMRNIMIKSKRLDLHDAMFFYPRYISPIKERKMKKGEYDYLMETPMFDLIENILENWGEDKERYCKILRENIDKKYSKV